MSCEPRALTGVSPDGRSGRIGIQVAHSSKLAARGSTQIPHVPCPTCVTIGRPRGFAAVHGKMAPRKKTTAKHKSDEVLIPDKLYFRIGEVAALCHLPAYVLRFWESEFPQLKPVKSSTGQRMYRKRDVESVLRIKQLLYEQGFTISGARQQLRSESKTDKTQTAIPFPSHSTPEIQHIRQGLREILSMLSARHTG